MLLAAAQGLINLEIASCCGIKRHRCCLGFQMNCADVWQVAALGVLDVVQQGARSGNRHGESAAAKAVEILSLELPL